MPLYKRWKDNNAEWAVWKVTETDEELLRRLSENLSYAEELARLKSSARRTEYLAVRVLLKTLLGRECEIAHYPSGKPYLPDAGLHVTISHTCGYVSVGIHPDREVGMDIEQRTHRVERVKNYFLHADEMQEFEALPRDDMLDWLLLHWSAKETMFKILDREGVSLRQHFRILPFVLHAEGTMNGLETFTGKEHAFAIKYFITPHFVCTWCTSLLP